jgi:hypothetical protein
MSSIERSKGSSTPEYILPFGDIMVDIIEAVGSYNTETGLFIAGMSLLLLVKKGETNRKAEAREILKKKTSNNPSRTYCQLPSTRTKELQNRPKEYRGPT